MKVVRSLPARHPSIIDFESFIITPSYALVTMPYCERLMPVGIDEVRPPRRALRSPAGWPSDGRR